MAFLAPLFFVGLAAVAVPILVHLIQRERKTVVEFPSLMFLRKIPYQSVERRRIHNWPLLLLRAAAMALLVAAFTRPFFKMDPLQAAMATSGAREVLILLDHSASMGYGDHFAKAKAEAKKIVDTIGADDKATVILFGTGAEEVVRGASDRGRLAAAIDAATVSSDGTRYAPVLRLAQSKLSQSTLPRKEAYLITDFQKTGWERQEEIHMPQGATLTPVSVASPGVSDLSVTSVAFQRTSFSGEERVTITAGLTNRSATAVTSLPVKLEIDGRVVDTRPVSIEPNASGSVSFAQVTAAVPGMRGTIRAGTDNLPKNNDFHFALSPSRPVSVLIIQAEGAASDASYYLTTVLSIGTAPPFKTEVLTPSRVTPASFERRSVVVLNDATALSTQTTDLLKRFVEQGGGLFISLKDRTPWSGTEMPLMPGTPGAPVDRLGSGTGGGTLGFLDYSHPIFDEFKDPRNGNFSSVRFYRYRGLTPGPTDKVLARFDDGAAAMVERALGSGRIIAFTSPFDATWNTFPQAHLFLPLVHETARYLAQYEEPEAWYTVGRMLDISVPIAAMVREGTAGDAPATSRKATGVVMSPGGAQVSLGDGGRNSVELLEQGFYSVRLQGMGERRPFQVAVNLDPAESDLSALPPAEFVNTVTGRVAAPLVGGDLEHPELTPADIEKKQSLWWFLFVAGAAALLAEAILANRLSKRFGFGLLQTGKT
jgi:aerotolerance regulator-like protein/VWA domain-containing protein